MRLVGAAEMRAIDRAAIDGAGGPGTGTGGPGTGSAAIPSLQLMARAAAAVARAAPGLARPGGRFVVLTGAGNNGGDGWLAALDLQRARREVRVVAVVDPEALDGDAAVAAARAIDGGVPWALFHPDAPLQVGAGDVVIDALLGTGLSRAPAGPFAQAIARIAEVRAGGSRVLAVDVPSGLLADGGPPPGPCVEADLTVTFAFMKRGLVLHPGPATAGEVRVVEIGIPPEAAASVPVTCDLLEEAEARALVPARPPEAHKGDAGRLLVVAGSAGKSGAAHLALLGALRGGAGLVTLAARPEVLGPALAGRPEAMSLALPAGGAEPAGGSAPLEAGDLPALLEAALGCDAVLLGPGIPRGPGTGALLLELLARAARPAVLDADALNALGAGPVALRALPAPVVLTPHPGEMARLCGLSTAEVQARRIELAAEQAEAWGAVIVLKGARTVVAAPGRPPAVIPTGNAGLATGGTGDVLAGLTAALLAGRLPPFDAARAAAWVHGAAADLLLARTGQRGLLASDLGDAIGRIWARWGR